MTTPHDPGRRRAVARYVTKLKCILTNRKARCYTVTHRETTVIREVTMLQLSLGYVVQADRERLAQAILNRVVRAPSQDPMGLLAGKILLGNFVTGLIQHDRL